MHTGPDITNLSAQRNQQGMEYNADICVKSCRDFYPTPSPPPMKGDKQKLEIQISLLHARRMPHQIAVVAAVAVASAFASVAFAAVVAVAFAPCTASCMSCTQLDWSCRKMWTLDSHPGKGVKMT